MEDSKLFQISDELDAAKNVVFKKYNIDEDTYYKMVMDYQKELHPLPLPLRIYNKVSYWILPSPIRLVVGFLLKGMKNG